MSEEPQALERVRGELRRLGYLDHGFERFLLQDALKPRDAGRTLAHLAAKVSLLAGVVLALVAAFALAAANGNLTATPFDLVPLFLHLLPPVILAVGTGFLALSGALVLVLRLYPLRRIESFCLGAALLAGAGTLGLALTYGRELVTGASAGQKALIAVVVPLVVFAVVKVIYNGLLSLGISLTDTAPRGRIFSRRSLVWAILGSAFLLTLPGLIAAGAPEEAPPPPTIPSSPGGRVLLWGLDGVLAEELEYLLARGELPALQGLLDDGGVLGTYPRSRDLPPASFWTSLVTGLPSSEHGVAAVDAFRPLGVRTSLPRTGPSRGYWHHVARPLGLAEHRPLLESRRRAFTVWELAARGGAPVTAVNWWGTFPAQRLPGLLLTHGAYQLLDEEVPEAVAPEERLEEMERLRRAVRLSSEIADRLAALPEGAADSVVSRALLPDQFYRQAFRRALEQKPRLAALYLAGPDLVAHDWRWGELALGDLVRAEIVAADRLLADALAASGRFDTVLVTVDPGRRNDLGRGRILLWRRGGCSTTSRRPELAPRAVASAALRALGLPQSRRLPPPPAECPWPPPPTHLDTFGERPTPTSLAAQSQEYLESLRSLGYL